MRTEDRYENANPTIECDRKGHPNIPGPEDLRSELETRRFQLAVLFQQASRDRRDRHGENWGLLREVYAEIEGALDSGMLRKMESAKVAYDRLPESAYRLVQPWSQRPEPTTAELLAKRADHAVLRFIEVDGKEYPRSYSPQLFEPSCILAGGLTHDFFAGPYAPVRVQIHELADKDAALDILREVVTFVDLNWDKIVAGEYPYSQDCNWSPTVEEVDQLMAEEEVSPSGWGWSDR